jgi:hypothetical protein
MKGVSWQETAILLSITPDIGPFGRAMKAKVAAAFRGC